jgi:SfnB family sulfur acquisition oxidoreductase
MTHSVDAPAAPLQRPQGKVTVISSDAEALTVAKTLSVDLAVGAATRDAQRQLPIEEIERLSTSGLLGISIPREYGGADVAVATQAEVFRLLAVGDPNVAQIPQSHFVYVNVLRHQGTDAQKRLLFGEILAGRRLGNAQSEAGTKHVQDIRTRLTKVDAETYLLSGVKNYCTGALFAHWIPVLARGEDENLYVAYVKADSDGVTLYDDWDGMGQRTTASGSVHLDKVVVPAELVVPHFLTFTGPQVFGAVAQVLHAAIDTGIGRAALSESVRFVRESSRPWWESGVERASEDPLTIQRFGELEIKVRAAEALLAVAATSIDSAASDLTETSAAEASISVATAKAFVDSVAVELGSALFEVSGTRSSLQSTNLDRFWRNARTHTLHDPARWKVQHIGRFVLNGTLPPRHGQL